MNALFWILVGCVVLLLVLTLVLVVLNKKIQEREVAAEAEAKGAKKALDYWKSLESLKNEERKDAEDKKKKLHKGTDTDRFNSSFDILHNN